MQKITRRQFNSFLASGLLTFTGCSSITRNVAAKRRPNVILIMTDDQGWGDISSHGNDILNTPALDKLASEGVRFDRFYVTPLCAPTRAALLTGRYHLRTGVHWVTRGKETMRSNETTIAELLKRSSYTTGCFGKWHNGSHYPNNPKGQGFDEFYGFCGGHSNYFDTTVEHNSRPIKTKGYLTELITEAALKFIEKNQNKPFFCYLPYNSPHTPWQLPDKYFNKYKNKGLTDTLASAYGMCENIDDNVARILQKLDRLNLTDDTIVIFLTDNGPNSKRFNANIKGTKGSHHEGGTRVPFFIRWPNRLPAGKTVTDIAACIDVLPTVADLCNVSTQGTLPLDGISLVPLLKEQEPVWPNRMIFTFPTAEQVSSPYPGSVRTQKFRAVNYQGKWSLYKMSTDPYQKKDVAEKYPTYLKTLTTAYEKAFADVTKDGLEITPIALGYPQSPKTTLYAHEAALEPQVGRGISYSGPKGWTGEWVTNYTSIESYLWWDVDVVEKSVFEVALMYTCSKENLNCKARIEIAGQTLDVTVDQPYDPELIPTYDRVPKVCSREKPFKPLNAGTLNLNKGRYRLKLRMLEIPGQKACDIKALILKRIV
ncbi:MAG: arylsulfatase [Planctomycetota bacterium]|jgi:arylsulfatase A